MTFFNDAEFSANFALAAANSPDIAFKALSMDCNPFL